MERPKLVGTSVPELLAHLKDPEDWSRQQAKRVLKERGAKDVTSDLASWMSQLDPKDSDFEHQRLEGLWTYQSLDVVKPDLLASLLKSPDPRVRAAAVRVLRHWHDRLDNPIALLIDRVEDENPRVRLEAVRALAQIPSSHAAEVAMRAIDKPVDRFLDYALWLTARDLKSSWLPAVTTGKLDTLGTPAHLVYGLRSVATPEVVEPLLKLIRSGSVPPAQEQSALTLVATLGQPRDLAMIFEIIVQKDDRPAASKALLLDGLVKAAKQRNVRPDVNFLQLAPLIEGPDDSLRIAAARAAGAWKATDLVSRLEVTINDPKGSAATRDAAVESLLQIGGSSADASLERLAQGSPSRLGRLAAMRALAMRNPARGSRMVVDFLGTSKDPTEAEAAVRQFSGVKNGALALGVALKDATLPADAARLALRAANAAQPEEPLLIQSIRKAGRLDMARTFSPEEKAALLADVAAHGDAARGEAIYRAKSNQCLTCHAIAGAGGQVGPSLESVGASAPPDYLLDSLLEPGKAVKENYHSMVVVTVDGLVLTGIKVRQTDQELVLRDVNDRERAIPLASIEEQKTGGSLMPSGLVDPLTRSELVDLVRFLSELGKIGPYSVGKDRVFRRWAVLEADGKAYTELRRWGLQSAASPNPALTWSPAYSKVSGELPLAELPLIRLDDLPGSGPEVGATGFAYSQISVSTPGTVKLAWNTAKGLRIWVDGTPAEAKDNAIVLDLASGLHTITVAVEKSLRQDPLRCTLEDVPGSPARAQVVLGK